LALDPQDAWCHFAMGLVRRLQHRFDDAINDIEAAIRLDPNMHVAHIQLAWLKVYSGRGEDALPQFAKTIHLSPREPRMFFGYFGIGYVRFLLGEDDGAIEMVRKAIALNPNYSPSYLSYLCLTAALGMQGRIEAARAALAAYLQTGTPTSTIARLRAHPLSSHPNYLVQRERIYEGLRKAGDAGGMSACYRCTCAVPLAVPP
jgi:adenylate cyclase